MADRCLTGLRERIAETSLAAEIARQQFNDSDNIQGQKTRRYFALNRFLENIIVERNLIKAYQYASQTDRYQVRYNELGRIMDEMKDSVRNR